MTAYTPTQEKPGMLTAITILTLISGITNILIGIGLSAGIVISTLGIGLLCVPLTILPIILGIFEIIYSTQLLSNPPKVAKLNTTIAILELIAILVGNVISLVTGILVLVAQNDPAVKNYLAQYGSPRVY
jgi:hypothetical protein